MTLSDNAGSFGETLQAIAAGDETVTNELTAEIIPELLTFALEHDAKDAQELVGRVLLDAFRKADHFSGTKRQFVSTLCRVIDTLIKNESIKAESTKNDSIKNESVKNESVKNESVKNESPNREPTTPAVSAGSFATPRQKTPAARIQPLPTASKSRSTSLSPTPTFTTGVKTSAAPSTRTSTLPSAYPAVKSSAVPTTKKPEVKPPFQPSETVKASLKDSKPEVAKATTVTSTSTKQTSTLPKPGETKPTPSPPTKPLVAAPSTTKPRTETLTVDGSTSAVVSTGEEKALARSRQLLLGVGLALLALPLLYLLLNSFRSDASGNTIVVQQGQQIIGSISESSQAANISDDITTASPQPTEDAADNKAPSNDEADDLAENAEDQEDAVPAAAVCSVTFYANSQYSGSEQSYSTSQSSMPVAYRSAEGNCTFSVYADSGFAGSCTTFLAGKAPSLVAGISSFRINKSC